MDKENIIRVSNKNPRSEYLFYLRTLKILNKNHNNKLSYKLKNKLDDLLFEARLAYKFPKH